MLCLKQEGFVFHQWITPEETWFSLSEQVLLVFSLTTNWKYSDILQNFIFWSSESSFSYPRYMQKWSYRAKFWWTSKGTFHRKRSIDVTVLWLFCFSQFLCSFTVQDYYRIRRHSASPGSSVERQRRHKIVEKMLHHEKLFTTIFLRWRWRGKFVLTLRSKIRRS